MKKKKNELMEQEPETSLAPERAPRKKGSSDYGKTIRWLYAVAIGLAVVAFVLIGVKTYQDLTAGSSAEALLQAYKDMATPTPVPTTAVMEISNSEPSATPDASASPEASLAPEVDSHIFEDNSAEVDEAGDYVQPDAPDAKSYDDVIKQVASAIGDEGVIGILEIPETGHELPIIGKWSYNLLKISVCRYQGPGVNEAGNLVVIGHNYKSGAHFGDLDELKEGSEIFLTGTDNKRVRYEVYEIKKVAPDAFSELDKYEGERGLTLMTCMNNGNNRRIVRCVQKDAPSTSTASTVVQN